MAHELSLEIKKIKNKRFNNYLQMLNNEKTSNYSLWKSTTNLNRPTTQIPPIHMAAGKWARTNSQKAELFSSYLAGVFSLDTNPSAITQQVSSQNDLDDYTIPIEVFEQIHLNLKLTKCPGFDLITTEVLKRLPNNIIVKLTQIINASLRLLYVPSFWKVAEVVMIPKPGKPATEVKSYRPISLLPILSKLYERILQVLIKRIIEQRNLIPKI